MGSWSKAVMYFAVFATLAAAAMVYYVYSSYSKEKFEDAGDQFEASGEGKDQDEETLYRNRVLVMKLFDSLLLRKATHAEIEKYSGIGAESDIVRSIMTDYHIDGKKIVADGAGVKESGAGSKSREAAEELAEGASPADGEEYAEDSESLQQKAETKADSANSAADAAAKEVAGKEVPDKGVPERDVPDKEAAKPSTPASASASASASSDKKSLTTTQKASQEQKEQQQQKEQPRVESFADFMPYQSVRSCQDGDDDLADRRSYPMQSKNASHVPAYYTRAKPVVFAPQDLLPGAPRFQDRSAAPALPTWGADGSGYAGLYEDTAAAAKTQQQSDLELRLKDLTAEVSRLSSLLTASAPAPAPAVALASA